MGARVAVVVERNRVAAARIARVVSAATDLAPVVCGPDAEQLKSLLPTEPGLLLCDAQEQALVEGWLELWPDLRVMVWTTGSPEAAIRLARREPRVRSIVGWPAFGSIPRPLDLAVSARRLVTGEPLPSLSSLLPWGATLRSWLPRTSSDRDRVVTDLGALLEQARVPPRNAARASEVAHELLMNAMYVAPVDAWGQPRYARDRTAAIALDAGEIPSLTLGFDGQLLALEVADSFGRLRDEQVLDGLLRGFANQAPGAREAELDTGGGGAGLGLSMVHASSVAVMIEVRPGLSTRVLWLHDVDVAQRDYRSLPASLHLFRTPGGRS